MSRRYSTTLCLENIPDILAVTRESIVGMFLTQSVDPDRDANDFQNLTGIHFSRAKYT